MMHERDASMERECDVPVVAFEGISKTYPNGTIALNKVSFAILPGTIHAICGENGAGKSTLMKILFGLEQPSEGAILFEGNPVRVDDRDFAGTHGIGMVHQHFSLIPTLTVTENIILGHEPRKGLLIDRRAARVQVEELSKRYRLAVDPDALTGKLSIAAQQKVEILKALSRNTKLLILDEPTAVLSPPEIDELFVKLQDLRDQGLTILFISHKLNEVRRLAESVTVLRGGRLLGTARLEDIPDDQIMQMVMGRPVALTHRQPRPIAGEPIVKVLGVTLVGDDPSDQVSDVSFGIHSGEIVGVAGVDGSGQRGLVSMLSGMAVPTSGTIDLLGQPMATASVSKWRKNGLAHLPSDRLTQGGAPALSLLENAIAGTDGSGEIQLGPFLKRNGIARKVRRMVAEYSVRTLGIYERLDSLSGGNAQKLIAARELATSPRFLIADQPTRGIDVASAAFLHARIAEAAERGAGVLLVTADLDELLRLSDRVIVMFGGCVTADLRNGTHLTPEVLGPYMLGLKVALVIPAPGFIAPLIAISIGALIGSLACVVPGYLRLRFDAPEMVTSLVLNYAILYAGLYVLNYYLRDPDAGALMSYRIPEAAKLGRLLTGTRLNSGAIIALVICFGGGIWMFLTRSGLNVRIIGLSPGFAAHLGLPTFRIILGAQLIGGMIAGMAGAIEVLGLYPRFSWTHLPGLGWTGIIVAILARENPFLIVPAALFLGYLQVGGDFLARDMGIPSEVVGLMTAAIMVCVTASAIFHHPALLRFIRNVHGQEV